MKPYEVPLFKSLLRAIQALVIGLPIGDRLADEVETFCESFDNPPTVCYLVHSAAKCFVWICFLVACVLFLESFICSFIPEFPYKWIRRERDLLVALIEDVKYVSETGTKINEHASQIWGSLLRPVVTGSKLDAYRGWADATKEVVSKANHCLETYEKLSQRKKFPKRLYFCIWNFWAKYSLGEKIGQITSELNRIRKKYEDAAKICGSLECLVSRGLQERLLEHAIHQTPPNLLIYQNPGPRFDCFLFRLPFNDWYWLVITILLEILFDTFPFNDWFGFAITFLIEFGLDTLAFNGWFGDTKFPFNDWFGATKLPLNLLIAYLKDLGVVRSETESGNAWLKEAKEIIELVHGTDMTQNSTASRTGWLFKQMAKLKFQFWRESEDVTNLISDLFERKDAFGINLIGRETTKSIVGRSPLSRDSINEVYGTLLDNIKCKISQEPDIKISEKLGRLHGQFSEVYDLLIDAVGGANVRWHSGMAWMDQMKVIVTRAEYGLKTYNRKRDFFSHFYRRKNEFLPSEFGQFGLAIRILKLSIKVCRIEPRVKNNVVVGLGEDTDKVVSQLTSNSECFSTVSIVGMRGIGKSTLAKVIYNHEAIQVHFLKRYLVPVPDSAVDVNELLKLLGNQILPTPEERNEDADKIGPMVKRFLQNMKYLVILDNISTQEDLNTLKEAFPKSNGSRILITTRYESVASHANSVHPLRLRTKDESWGLFTQMVPSKSENQNVETLVRKVVGRCGGLPLSILHLGYLMSGKKVTAEDLRLLEHMNHSQTAWTETLDINKRDLPLSLKQCLSYIGLFPRDYEIPRRRLVALWVAEGLVQQTGEEQEPLESVAEKYLLELIDHNLVQVVERKLNGKVKTCGFPSALRELWLLDNSSSIFVQRAAYCSDGNGSGSSHSHVSGIYSPNILQRRRNLRSILFFDTREGNKPGADIGNLLRSSITSGHLLQLQVLDLEHVYRPQLPNTIGRLTDLTYLGLRWTYLEKIPSSIGNLVNLQTLDVKHTYIRVLPNSIWKLQKLRHLYMNQTYRSKFESHKIVNSLQNLKTLRGAFVDKDSPLKDGLHSLTNLRKLALAIQLELSQQEAVAESLLKLKHLQTLKLKSIDKMSRPQDLKTMFLPGLENLCKLYLFGKLENTTISGLPKNLTDLTLSSSKLSDDPMPELKKLCNLKWLSFYSGSFTGATMVCSGGFPQLLVLKFWMLEELEEWDVMETAMPNLKKLEIRSCRRLKVPTGLKHLKIIRELKLQHMPVEFTTEIDQNQEQIWVDNAIIPELIIDEK